MLNFQAPWFSYGRKNVKNGPLRSICSAASPARKQCIQGRQQQRGKPGKHRDVQARDAHQMRHAGRARNTSQSALYGILVAHHQRDQHTSGLPVVNALINRLLHRRARTLDRVAQLLESLSGGASCGSARTWPVG